MAIQYNSNYDETIPFSDVCWQINCVSQVVQEITIPGESTTRYQASFSYTYDSNVFVRLNGVPESPGAGDIGDQQYNEFRPKKRYVKGGDIIRFVTPDDSAYIGLSIRQLQG